MDQPGVEEPSATVNRVPMGPSTNELDAAALAAALTVPRALFQRGDAKAAATELDHLAVQRPTLTDLPEGSIMVDRGPAKFGWHPRSKQQRRRGLPPRLLLSEAVDRP